MELTWRQYFLWIYGFLVYLDPFSSFLYLQECILDGLKEETQARILKRREEITESRAGERTAYVQKSK